jgi:hypothetical protein
VGLSHSFDESGEVVSHGELILVSCLKTCMENMRRLNLSGVTLIHSTR